MISRYIEMGLTCVDIMQYEALLMSAVLGPNLQNFVKRTFVILSQFFRISFVRQLISYRTKSLRKNCESFTKNIR